MKKNEFKFFTITGATLILCAVAGFVFGNAIDHEPHSLSIIFMLFGAGVVFALIERDFFTSNTPYTDELEINALISAKRHALAQSNNEGRRSKDRARSEVQKFMRCRG